MIFSLYLRRLPLHEAPDSDGFETWEPDLAKNSTLGNREQGGEWEPVPAGPEILPLVAKVYPEPSDDGDVDMRTNHAPAVSFFDMPVTSQRKRTISTMASVSWAQYFMRAANTFSRSSPVNFPHIASQ